MLRLSRLPPRASINVRFTAPGHANPYFLDRAHFIDPSHPTAKLSLRNIPSFVCPQFTLHAFPNPILQEPTDFVPVNPLLATHFARARAKIDHIQQSKTNASWSTFCEKEGHRRWSSLEEMKRHVKYLTARQLADARVAALAKNGRRNVNLLFHTSKKTTSKSSVIRRKLRTKVASAINLVVSRGADAIHAPSGGSQPVPTIAKQPSYLPLILVSRPLQESDSLMRQDWTYLVTPSLAIYKTPLPNLVQAVRTALCSLRDQSRRLEYSISKKKQLPSAYLPSQLWRSKRSKIPRTQNEGARTK